MNRCRVAAQLAAHALSPVIPGRDQAQRGHGDASACPGRHQFQSHRIRPSHRLQQWRHRPPTEYGCAMLIPQRLVQHFEIRRIQAHGDGTAFVDQACPAPHESRASGPEAGCAAPWRTTWRAISQASFSNSLRHDGLHLFEVFVQRLQHSGSTRCTPRGLRLLIWSSRRCCHCCCVSRASLSQTLGMTFCAGLLQHLLQLVIKCGRLWLLR